MTSGGMTSGTQQLQRATLVVLVAAALYFLYFFGLSGTGLIGPDEPRYAAIGRAMAETGDWVTPRLWGEPWFEKPALSYWMTAAGFKMGLGPELAPRLPVAIISIVFLIYFSVALRREFGASAAWHSTAILGTSVGWLAYSHVAITDLPMSAAIAATMLTIFGGAAGTGSFIAAGVLLGLAVLAKGLVPLVLLIPALWFLRRRIRDLALLFGAAIVVAGPWYALVSTRNPMFVEEFIWKHHFSRFLNSALQHEQPFWFYVPVLLAGLFPWTPVLAIVANAKIIRDRRTLFLLAWFVWGFVFFSISRNKLPGYLLPVLPPVAALMGVALARTGNRAGRALVAISGGLLCLIPAVIAALPRALEVGASRASFHLAWPWLAAGAAAAIVCAVAKRDRAVAIVAALTTASVAALVTIDYPQLDRQLSGREASLSMTCLPATNRSQRYSIDYYVGRNLPDCK